jgi:glycosyltransferase involved in cell wall biosynthesis
MEIKSKKRKLCHLITQTHFGGAQKYICDIANELANEYDITIAFGEGSADEFKKHLTNPSIKIIQLKHLIRNINIFKDFLAFWELISFFKKNKFNILHLHSSKAGFIASWTGKLARIEKIIYTAHGWVFKEDLNQFKKNFYLFLEKFGARFKDKIICVSEDDYNLALKNKITKEDKLVLIYNGIKMNTEFLNEEEAREVIFDKIRKNNPSNDLGFDISSLETKSKKPSTNYIPLDKNTKIIGTISNLYPNKGLNYLIEVAQKLNIIYQNLVFVVIGSGPEEKKLKDLVIKKNLLNFYFLGKIDQAAKYLKAFDIFTLTSIKEGLPYTLLEALKAEISIVSSNLTSLSEIIVNNQNGLIFKATNSDDLVYKIQSLLNNQDFANKLKSNTKNSLSKFDFNEFINNIKTLYLS